MTPPSWTPEQVVGPDLATELIDTQFPHLAPSVARFVGSGWDNTVYLVNESYIFRFPRRKLGAECLEAEIRLMPSVAPHLPLRITAPALVGKPTDRFLWSFAGYPEVPGRTACQVALDAAQRRRTIPALAGFLSALHSFPAGRARECGAGGDTIGRLDAARRIRRALDSLPELAERGLIENVATVEHIFTTAGEFGEPRQDVLVHGDLYARHLVLDSGGAISGVIDWGDVHLGDPAVDLALIHAWLPPETHDEFLDSYGPVGERTWALARVRALWHMLYLLPYAAEQDDGPLAAECRQALRYIIRRG